MNRGFRDTAKKLHTIYLASILCILIFNFADEVLAADKSPTKDEVEAMTSQNKIDSEKKRMLDKFEDCCVKITPHTITAKEAINKHLQKNVVFIDVREEEEQDISMIKGAIRFEDFTISKASTNVTYVVYCTIGYRSGEFTKKLRRKGLKAYNLIGGILGWTYEDGKIYDKSGQSTKSVHTYSRSWDYLRSDYEAKY